MHRGTSICPSTSLKGGNDADGAVIRRGFLSYKLGKHNEKTQEVAERGNCGANNVKKFGSECYNAAGHLKKSERERRQNGKHQQSDFNEPTQEVHNRAKRISG